MNLTSPLRVLIVDLTSSRTWNECPIRPNAASSSAFPTRRRRFRLVFPSPASTAESIRPTPETVKGTSTPRRRTPSRSRDLGFQLDGDLPEADVLQGLEEGTRGLLRR